MKKDRQEKYFWNKKKFKIVDEMVEEEFKSTPVMLDLCHRKWARKKQLLKQLYNIDWHTPAELNPDIIFD